MRACRRRNLRLPGATGTPPFAISDSSARAISMPCRPPSRAAGPLPRRSRAPRKMPSSRRFRRAGTAISGPVRLRLDVLHGRPIALERDVRIPAFLVGEHHFVAVVYPGVAVLVAEIEGFA